MKNKIKIAFSMAELLIVLALISFVIISELIIVNRKTNEYGSVYYNAYNTIRKVTSNIYIDTYCPNSSKILPEEGYDKDYDCTLGPRAFPKDTKELCKRYAEYFNIPGGDADCVTFGDISNTANNFSDDKTLMFKTSNGFKFYLSGDISRVPYKHTIKDSKGVVQGVVEYFILYVDINGEKAPNRVDQAKGSQTLPDIVPFGITRRGEVIPMGFPVYSTAYLTAKVRFPDTDELKENMSGSMSFYDAVKTAWNNEEDFQMPFTYQLNNDMRSDSLAKYYTIPASTVSSIDSRCESGTYYCKVLIDSSTQVR